MIDKEQEKRNFSESIIEFKPLKHEIQPIIYKYYIVLRGRRFSPLQKSTVDVLSGYIICYENHTKLQ